MNTHAAKVIDALGGTAQVARMFDVRMPSVSNWKKNGIPRASMMFLRLAHAQALAGIDLDAAVTQKHHPALATQAPAAINNGLQEVVHG